MEIQARGATSEPRVRLFHALVHHRRLIQTSVDLVAWGIALPLGSVLRHDLHLDDIDLGRLLLLVAVAWLVQLVVGAHEGLYKGRYSYGAFEEASALVRTVLVVGVVVAVANRYLGAPSAPRSVPLIGSLLALIAMSGVRYGWRITVERLKRPTLASADPVLVFGAGEGGAQLLTSMLRNPDSPYVPVGLLDDDPSKRHRRLRGVPVLGDRAALGSVAEDLHAKALIIAIPSASAEVVRDLSARAAEAHLEVRVLPPVSELFGAPDIGDVRPLTEADLLGRHEVDIDLAAIAEYVTGKRVLVTGAGGSIGSELCRQLARFEPETLIMLDRDESALHAVELSLKGRAMLDGGDLVVADLRDAERLREVFQRHLPEVVFHAAALKHLTLLEQHPAEGVKTNVVGTVNVVQASLATGVDRFVNISTDKAADPTSVLGYTKRLAERITAWASGQRGGSYISVRFGNVLGSRGSVLTAFRAQIEAGGPVTVTHPDVTRYFMTVEEAVQLVIQAGAVGRDGEALVLDMGTPVPIAEVAHRLIEESGQDIEVVYTGLRPGEKLHEVLRADDEADERPAHPLISHVAVPALDPEGVGSALSGDRDALAALCAAASPSHSLL